MSLPEQETNSSFDVSSFWDEEFEEHTETARLTQASLSAPFMQWVDVCTDSIQQGGKIMFFGNGGSAADAQHLATELSVRFIDDRPPIAGIALTTDTSSLTAIGNDFGFEHLFSRQIEALGHEGDIAVGLSTSGNSANVLNAFSQAKKQGIITIGMTGHSGGKMADVSDILLAVPNKATARIQEMHIILGHMFCGALEKKLGLV